MKMPIQMMVPQFVDDPIYTPATLPEHKGNPLIEALLPFKRAERMIKEFGQYPLYCDADRTMAVEDRMLAVSRLEMYLEPLPHHFQVIERINMVIRSGYVHRNPTNVYDRKRLNQLYRTSIARGEPIALNQSKPTSASSLTLLGVSGCGKSSVVERTLAFLPQVIVHKKYGVIQVVWVKLECPKKGGVRPFLLDLVGEIGNLVGTDYRKLYARANIDELVNAVVKVSAMHYVGAIIVDEIQNLFFANGTDRQELLNTLVKFTNLIKTPIIMIGTPRAKSILQKTFREARRAGDYHFWGPLNENEIWDLFFNKMWKFQWTTKPAAATKNMKKLFFKHTQGIPALIIRLFQLTQLDAIGHDNECITEAIVEEVASERFILIAPMLEALKRGDQEAIDRYQDLFIDRLAIMTNDVNNLSKLTLLETQSQQTQTRLHERSKTISALIYLGYPEGPISIKVDAYFNEKPEAISGEAVNHILTSFLSEGKETSISLGKSLREIVKDADAVGIDPVAALAGTGIVRKLEAQ